MANHSFRTSRRKVLGRRLRLTVQGLEDRSVPATHLVLSGITSATAGVAQTVTVTAANADGSTNTGYGGTIHFASNDPQAVLPANTGLTNGVGTFNVTFKTAGRDTLTAVDIANGNINGGLSAGGSSTAYTQPATGAAGDKSAWYPPDGLDGDQYIWEAFTLPTTQSISEVDWRGYYTNYQSGAGQSPAFDFTVAIWPNSPYPINEPNVVGTPLVQYTVGGNAGETQNGTVGGYTGYDYQYTLPTAFNAQGGTRYWLQIIAWQGVTPFYYWPPDWHWAAGTGGDGGHFREVIGGSLAGGNAFQQISGDVAFTLVTPANLPGVPVNPAATSKFVVSGLASPMTAGNTGTWTVTAEDPFGNVTPGYNGTVRFTSSDFQAGLPADYVFGSGDQGTRNFNVTFKTAGTQSVTVTDTLDGSIQATTSGLTTNPAAAATLGVGGFPSPTMAGVSHPLTVTAYDAFGNVATGYTGIVHFVSSDAQATLPADYPFVLADQGQRAFATTLNSLGVWSLTARDTQAASITGTEPNIHVIPAVTLGNLSVARWTTGKSGYSGTIGVSGGDGTYTLNSVTGLPAGLRGDLSGATITFGGTPTGAGTYPITVTVADGSGATVSRNYAFTVDPSGTLSWTGLGADNKWTDAANWSGAAPTAGATLVFGPGAMQTSAVNDFPAGTKFKAIDLLAGGYNLTGNAIQLTNGIDAAGIGPTGAVIDLPIGLTATETFGVMDLTDVLEIRGPVSGRKVGMTKTGAGTLAFTGTAANTYTGSTTVNGGMLRLDRPAITVAGPVAIHAAQLVYGGFGNQIADTTSVTIGEGGGLDLNGQSDKIGALTVTGGTVATGTGTLTLNGNVTSKPSATEATISGNLDLGGRTRTFAVGNGAAGEDLTIAANVSNGWVTKTGVGALVLSGTNTYGGVTAVKAGVLDARNQSALGTTAGGTSVSRGATLEIEQESGQAFGDALTLGSGATLLMLGGSNTWTGNITLTGTATITVGAGDLTLAGTIRGAGGLTKAGPGVLNITGANTFTGRTTVAGGTLGGTGRVAKLTVGAGAHLAASGLSSGNVAFGPTAVMDIAVGPSAAGPLTVKGTVNLGGATLNLTQLGPTAVGDSFTVIANDGNDPVVGTFAGLAEGATLTVGGAVFQITYKGGTGNDVVVTQIA